MTLAAVPDQQTTIEEQIVDDPALEQALRERQAAKDSAGAARKAADEAHEKVVEALAQHELADGGVLRCGTWRISKKAVDSRHVEFDTEATSRTQITLLTD